jgi:hypothetical protein
MRNKWFNQRHIILIIIGILFALGDAMLVSFVYIEFSDKMLSSNGGILGVFVSLVVIGVLFPSILFVYIYKQR